MGTSKQNKKTVLYRFIGTIGELKKIMRAEYEECTECGGQGVNHYSGCIAVD